MSKDKQIYKQCRLEKQISKTGKQVDVAWIPSSLAKLGKTLSIKRNEEWADGWVVISVDNTMEIDELDTQRKAQKDWEYVLGDGIRK